jgi:hypothetical protein
VLRQCTNEWVRVVEAGVRGLWMYVGANVCIWGFVGCNGFGLAVIFLFCRILFSAKQVKREKIFLEVFRPSRCCGNFVMYCGVNGKAIVAAFC